MRAAVWDGSEQLVIQDVPRPDPKPGWVEIEVAYNGICGTDLAIWHGVHPRAKAPLIMGHEMVGWISRSEDPGLLVGQLVSAAPLISCGECWACRNGHAHVCRDLKLYGIDAPGAFAEYVCLPAEVVYPLAGNLVGGSGLRIAALAEPLAVAVHALSLAELNPGDLAAVWGGGPIGMLTALMARYKGAGQVVLCEPQDWRRQVAADAGFTVCADAEEMKAKLAELSGGEGADISFDTAAHPSVAIELCETTRVRGRIIIVGVYKQPAPMVLRDICFKEQSLQGVRVYTSDDFAEAVRLIDQGALPLESVPTTVFTLENTQAALEAAAGGAECLKVLVTPWKELA